MGWQADRPPPLTIALLPLWTPISGDGFESLRLPCLHKIRFSSGLSILRLPFDTGGPQVFSRDRAGADGAFRGIVIGRGGK